MIWLLTLPLALCALVFTLATSALWDSLMATPYAGHFISGVTLGLLIGAAIIRFFPLLFVLDHEVTHFFAALMIFRKPVMIAAEARSGLVIIEGRGSTFISLAPHSIPVLALLSLLLLLITDHVARPWVIGFIGLAWGYHAATDVYDAITGGSDLSKVGPVASRTLIVCGWCLLYPMVAIAALGGWPRVREWAELAWQLALVMGQFILPLGG